MAPHSYSCLKNPTDRGAWWASAHGVTKSRTWLSDFPFTFHFHALEKEMATHSSVLAWRIPGTGEPGGLPSMGSHRVGHDWSDLAAAAAAAFLPKWTKKKKSSGFPTTQKASFGWVLVFGVPPQNQGGSWSVYWQRCKETGKDVNDSIADGRQPEKKAVLWKEKYQKDLAASWAKGRLIWKKKKKKDVKADPNTKKKRGERQRRRDKWRGGR